jgi:hypothetical protein
MPYKDPVKAKEYAESYRAKNKGKQAYHNKRFREQNKELIKQYSVNYYLSKRFDKYGITQEQFTLNLMAQENKCAICNISFSDLVRTYVDHCHTTGKIRGIICFHCNTGLGHFKDNITLLEKARKYLNDPPFNYS